MGGVVSSDPNPSTSGIEEALAMAIDVAGDRMYIAGTSITGAMDLQWQIEKRSLSTGAGDGAFGTAGVLVIDPSLADDELRGIAIDAAGGFIYLVGDDGSNGGFDRRWRIEKRQLADGSLVGAFGSGGAILEDPGTGFDFGLDAFLDGDSLYVSGLAHVNPPFPGENFRIEIEKRDAVTGALVPSFGAGGVMTEDPTVFADGLAVLGADGTHIYLAGIDGLGFVTTRNTGWRIEKRTE